MCPRPINSSSFIGLSRKGDLPWIRVWRWEEVFWRCLSDHSSTINVIVAPLSFFSQKYSLIKSLSISLTNTVSLSCTHILSLSLAHTFFHSCTHSSSSAHILSLQHTFPIFTLMNCSLTLFAVFHTPLLSQTHEYSFSQNPSLAHTWRARSHPKLSWKPLYFITLMFTLTHTIVTSQAPPSCTHLYSLAHPLLCISPTFVL